MTSVPILNLPNGYINGLQLTFYAINKHVLAISPGQCRDSTNTYDIVVPSLLSMYVSISGINGLDTGTVTNDTMYYVYVISDTISGLPPACLFSLSPTQPVIPYGYQAFRLIGCCPTGAAGLFYTFNVGGDANVRRYALDTCIDVLGGGTETDLTPVDLDGYVPAIDNTPIRLVVSMTPDGNGGLVNIVPFGSTSVQGAMVSGDKAAVLQKRMVTVLAKLDTTPKILYANDVPDNLTALRLIGFDMFL